MKNLPALFIILILLGSSGGLLWSCETWELPTKKTKRNCVPPSGTLAAQIQQLKVDFSITNSIGTIDGVLWDFGNGSTTATTGMTVSYTYPASGTYNAKATLTNTCGQEAVLLRTISVSSAVDPIVTLQPVTEFTTTSAVLRMTVTSNGNSTITRYGVCYSPTSMTPTADNNNATTVSVAGSVVLNTSVPISITALQPNTLYYARSFATNSAGTGYSATQNFRTGQNPVVTVNGTATIGSTTAAVNFVAVNAGNPAAVEYGVYYSSSTSTPDDKSSVVKVTSPAVGANVVVNLTDLTPNKTYYYRPYAKLPSGEIVYGPIMSFTTQMDVVAQDLIASVSFTNGSLLDVSGYNNHVKLVGTTFTTDRKGNTGSAILLNGAGDYFYMPENNSLNPEALSISIWIKPVAIPAGVDGRMQIYNKARFGDGLPQTYSSLIKLENDTGPNLTFITDIKQNSNCQGGIGWQSFPFTKPVELNKWYHLVFTYSGRSARMYFNNILVNTTDNLPADKMDACSGGELKFGAQYQSLPWYFKGAMDDIRIYKRALTANEVQTLFNQ